MLEIDGVKEVINEKLFTAYQKTKYQPLTVKGLKT